MAFNRWAFQVGYDPNRANDEFQSARRINTAWATDRAVFIARRPIAGNDMTSFNDLVSHEHSTHSTSVQILLPENIFSAMLVHGLFLDSHTFVINQLDLP